MFLTVMPGVKSFDFEPASPLTALTQELRLPGEGRYTSTPSSPPAGSCR
jgi:hypothetical protein